MLRGFSSPAEQPMLYVSTYQAGEELRWASPVDSPQETSPPGSFPSEFSSSFMPAAECWVLYSAPVSPISRLPRSCGCSAATPCYEGTNKKLVLLMACCGVPCWMGRPLWQESASVCGNSFCTVEE